MRAQIRRLMRETAAAGAAPARVVRSHAPGRLRDPPWGHYGPCARSSLTARFITGHASADRSWANAERHSLEPQQGAERRAGRRNRPVISGAPEMGPLARRTIGCGDPHQRLSALCSPHIFRERNRDKGIRRPPRNRTMALGCLTIESDHKMRNAFRPHRVELSATCSSLRLKNHDSPRNSASITRPTPCEASLITFSENWPNA
jgi:hypothetical protein